ncbi:MAG: flagellar protein FliT [Comamonadaceae bacterium]|nr:flagellar protein FliT [Comamonadaceae bacterium]
MVEAARANDWDRLTNLEQDVARLRDTLAANDSQPAPAPLSPEERAWKVQLIRRILADDAEVRSYTEPWMNNVRKYLRRRSALPKRAASLWPLT